MRGRKDGWPRRKQEARREGNKPAANQRMKVDKSSLGLRTFFESCNPAGIAARCCKTHMNPLKTRHTILVFAKGGAAPPTHPCFLKRVALQKLLHGQHKEPPKS